MQLEKTFGLLDILYLPKLLGGCPQKCYLCFVNNSLSSMAIPRFLPSKDFYLFICFLILFFYHQSSFPFFSFQSSETFYRLVSFERCLSKPDAISSKPLAVSFARRRVCKDETFILLRSTKTPLHHTITFMAGLVKHSLAKSAILNSPGKYFGEMLIQSFFKSKHIFRMENKKIHLSQP